MCVGAIIGLAGCVAPPNDTRPALGYRTNDISPSFCVAYARYDSGFSAGSKSMMLAAVDDEIPLAPAVERATLAAYRALLATPDFNPAHVNSTLTPEQQNVVLSFGAFDVTNYGTCVAHEVTKTPVQVRRDLIASGYLGR